VMARQANGTEDDPYEDRVSATWQPEQDDE
jgi:hypothetical protein